MRTLVALLIVSGSITSALADPAQPPAVNASSLPAQCRSVASSPPDARTPAPALDAAIFAANCTAMVNERQVRVTPTPAGAQALAQAISPSAALLDAVIQSSDPERQIVALHSKGDLYEGAAVRFLSMIPPLPPGSVGRDLATHYALVDAASQLVQPWRDQAKVAYAQVAAIAAQVPNLVASNPVIAYDVRDSAYGARSVIATR
ncbi:MAG: hypothetical protein JWO36_5999 [Myxococcales bacterium]|nr:hypothetical protein [Myxococcales bacterium]